MRRITVLFLAALSGPVLFGPILSGPVLAQSDDRLAVGEAIFTEYCASCHGVTATGDGIMSKVLSVPVPDLTAITARHDGFPHYEIAAKIDGRDPVLSHGGAMPVWGPVFDGVQSAFLRSDTGQPIVTSEPIAALVEWLEFIQD